MNNTLAGAGWQINEYRLLIPLNEALQDSIKEIRKELHERHKVKLPFELKPSLTILRCFAYSGMEAKFIERVQAISTGTDPFKMELRNFAAYPSHSIYVHVGTRSPFNDLVKELKAVRPLLNVPEHPPHFINEPHLMIAQKLKPFQFARMWAQCEHQEFSGKSIADGMILMRRTVMNPYYEQVRQFEFASLALGVKQGALFG